MRNRFLLQLLFGLGMGLLVFLGDVSAQDSVSAQADTGTRHTFLPVYPARADTDTVNYVIINKALWKESTSIRDTVLSRYPSDDINFMTHTGRPGSTHHFKADVNNYQLRPPNRNWIVFLLVTILIFLAVVRNGLSKNLPLLFQAYWSDRAISQFTRDDHLVKLRISSVYFLLFCLIYALMIMSFADFFGFSVRYDDIREYGFIFMMVVFFYLFKYVVLKFVSFLFDFSKLMSGYLTILSISNLIYAICVLPMFVFYQYLSAEWKPVAIYSAIALLVFNTFYKYLRSGAFIRSNFRFSKFYLFVYLCTLEIMPLLIIAKLILA